MPLKSFVCVLHSKGTLIAWITKSIGNKNAKQRIFVYIIYPFDKKNVTLPNNIWHLFLCFLCFFITFAFLATKIYQSLPTKTTYYFGINYL